VAAVPTVLRALLLAVIFTALPVGVGVAMTGGTSKPAPPPAYTSTALGDFDTTTVAITRGAFCDRIPAPAISAALGTAATAADAYGNGDRRPVAGGKADVLHEYGCTFSAAGLEARAWVFAPPVTVGRAHQLIADSDQGCTKPKDPPAFGSPTTASICGVKTRTATFRGLFGDAWLSCSLAAPAGRFSPEVLVDRAGRWCVAVAQAARRTS
jgi:hypothetical protein